MLIDHLRAQLRARDELSLRRERWVIEGAWRPRVKITHPRLGEREVLAFCSNDYLGLAADPRLRDALQQGAARWGTGSGASHVISGHGRAHEQLEHDLADWLAPCIPDARAITFCTGYMANLALMTALGGEMATIYADKLNHASLIDGGRFADAPMQRFMHGRLDVLAGQLARCQTPIKLIVTDSVFSMDGDVADLPGLLALAQAHDAWLVVDDAHGCGVLGDEGRGALAHFGLRSERLVVMGTLGKAAGVAGAFVAAHPVIVDWLSQAARPYLYTTASSPAMAHAASAAVALMRGADGERRRAKLRALVRQFRDGVEAILATPGPAGWTLPASQTPIQPLVVGDIDAALALSAHLFEAGIWAPAIRPPTVPAGTARLRFTLSATHEPEDVRQLLQALQAAREEWPRSGGPAPTDEACATQDAHHA